MKPIPIGPHPFFIDKWVFKINRIYEFYKANTK